MFDRWRARRRRRKTARAMDPFMLTDPWRSFVSSAKSAETRFARIVESVQEGPLRDRLTDVDERIQQGVAACWRIAEGGYRLHKMVLQVAASNSESVTRMRAREAETRDKLAALVKNLDEAVARGAELATGQFTALDSVADDVNAVVNDLEALRQAVAEVTPG